MARLTSRTNQTRVRTGFQVKLIEIRIHAPYENVLKALPSSGFRSVAQAYGSALPPRICSTGLTAFTFRAPRAFLMTVADLDEATIVADKSGGE